MEIWVIGILLGTLFATLAAFLWVVYELRGNTGPRTKKDQNYSANAEEDIEHIFNDEFREELRNRGRLHFEEIIKENSMFLQQDLRLTTSQLNEYMKDEMSRTLKEEFAKYEQSINDAKQIAIDSITKTQEAIEQQRQLLSEQLQQQFEEAKKQLINRFEENMADIINHYIMASIGDQIDLDDQLEYILLDLENNKEAIIDDIFHGA